MRSFSILSLLILATAALGVANADTPYQKRCFDMEGVGLVCASVTVTATGACQLTCEFQYQASGTASSVGTVAGALSYTNSPGDTCAGVNTCEMETADPLSYAIGTCHVGEASAAGLVGTITTLPATVHCGEPELSTGP